LHSNARQGERMSKEQRERAIEKTQGEILNNIRKRRTRPIFA